MVSTTQKMMTQDISKAKDGSVLIVATTVNIPNGETEAIETTVFDNKARKVFSTKRPSKNHSTLLNTYSDDGLVINEYHIMQNGEIGKVTTTSDKDGNCLSENFYDDSIIEYCYYDVDGHKLCGEFRNISPLSGSIMHTTRCINYVDSTEILNPFDKVKPEIQFGKKRYCIQNFDKDYNLINSTIYEVEDEFGIINECQKIIIDKLVDIYKTKIIMCARYKSVSSYIRDKLVLRVTIDKFKGTPPYIATVTEYDINSIPGMPILDKMSKWTSQKNINKDGEEVEHIFIDNHFSDSPCDSFTSEIYLKTLPEYNILIRLIREKKIDSNA